MGHSVDIFKVDSQILSERIDEALNSSLYKLPFDQYVEQYNAQHKAYDWAQLDVKKIIEKCKADVRQLRSTEVEEILHWLSHTNTNTPYKYWVYDEPEVAAKLKHFGFELFDDFDDRVYVFSFTYGNFLSSYYKDFNDDDRHTTCLNDSEYQKFIEYGLYLIATLLLEFENHQYLDVNDLNDIITRYSEDEKLKSSVEEDVTEIMESAKTEYYQSDPAKTETGELVPGVLHKNVVFPHYGRGAYIGDFQQVFFRLKNHKELLKDNKLHMIELA